MSGTVLEAFPAAGYTYLRLKATEGEIWAAVMKAEIKKGAVVRVTNASLMRNFASRTLNRTFPAIYFGTLGDGAGAAVAQAPASPGTPPKGAPAASGPKGPRLPKAEGPTGRTVAEVFAQKDQLKEKPVAVRARVTKFNAKILGRNWLHVEDGTGSAAGKDGDLTVTTADLAEVGDVVLLRGVVRVGKDFGAGYSYPVMVEGAKLEPAKR
ncbi:MAG: nucleotide-binding protein [Deltaproteobacteria bacterium]|nr:nucleotide-binding protein [Deltaproteobacteria bacterium]